MQLRCSLKSDIIMESKYTLLKCVLAFVEAEKPSVIELGSVFVGFLRNCVQHETLISCKYTLAIYKIM